MSFKNRNGIIAHAILLPVPRFRILDGLEIALDQSKTLLHRRHIRITGNSLQIFFYCIINYFLKSTVDLGLLE